MTHPHPTGFTLARQDLVAVAALLRLYAGGKSIPTPSSEIPKEIADAAKTFVTAGEINQASWAAAVHRDSRHNRTGRVGLLVHGIITQIQRLENIG